MTKKGGLVQRVERIEALERAVGDLKLETAHAFRDAREAAGLGLRDVAEQVHMSFQMVSLVEHGKALRTATLRVIAELLDAA